MPLDQADSLEEKIALIRQQPIENLLSAAYLEHELLPQLGLTGYAKDHLPEALHPYCGIGLEPVQAPNQFSKYLVHLASRKISSYLEIGVCLGGTFIITIEYLSRLQGAPITAMAIDQAILGPVRAYSHINPNVSTIEANTSDLCVVNGVKQRIWDLVLIDADHSFEGCGRDFDMVRNNAKLVAFHDIYSDLCPGVEKVWQRILSVTPRRCTWEFTEQYVEVLRKRNYRLFGIGVAELVHAPLAASPI